VTETRSGQPTMADYRSRSLWLDRALEHAERRPRLAEGRRADVVIVGGGLIGIWAAYTLAVEAPHLDVLVLERDVVGFGAAGRNGGWAGAGLAGAPGRYARRSGWDRVRDGAALFREAVPAIGRVVAAERIDCGFAQAGTLTVAATGPQAQRLVAGTHSAKRNGLAGPDDRMLSPDQARELVNLPNVRVAHFTPDCASFDPARFVRGLAEAAERRGVRIHEGSEVTDIRPHAVVTASGTVEAEHVVLATEAWAPRLPGGTLTSLPLTSMMIATEPLSAAVWEAIGWPHGLTVRDRSHLFFYAQRTEDDRIAIGGRGSPYRLRQPYAEFGERDQPVWDRLQRTLIAYFPAARDARITHRWGGILAVPRDWSMSIRTDREGSHRVGGLAGHGVVAAHIAGRTVADLVQGNGTRRTAMPWVGHRSRRWEPEPARYFAANAIVSLLTSADAYEDRTGRRARRAGLAVPFMPPA
jgi:glycine/D-amino acid oxidase-like deaminating enzyme